VRVALFCSSFDQRELPYLFLLRAEFSCFHSSSSPLTSRSRSKAQSPGHSLCSTVPAVAREGRYPLHHPMESGLSSRLLTLIAQSHQASDHLTNHAKRNLTRVHWFHNLAPAIRAPAEVLGALGKAAGEKGNEEALFPRRLGQRASPPFLGFKCLVLFGILVFQMALFLAGPVLTRRRRKRASSFPFSPAAFPRAWDFGGGDSVVGVWNFLKVFEGLGILGFCDLEDLDAGFIFGDCGGFGWVSGFCG